MVRPQHVVIRNAGKFWAVLIPKPVLAQLGLDDGTGAIITVDDDSLILRRPAIQSREGWAEAAQRIAEAGDDGLVAGEFGNAEDGEWVW